MRNLSYIFLTVGIIGGFLEGLGIAWWLIGYFYGVTVIGKMLNLILLGIILMSLSLFLILVQQMMRQDKIMSRVQDNLRGDR